MAMLKTRFSSVLILYGSSLIINRFLAALLLPVLTNILAPAEFGLWTLLQSLYLVLTTLALHGMDEAVMRFTSVKGNEQKSFFAAALSGALILAIILSIAAVLPIKGILSGNQFLTQYGLFFSIWIISDTLSIIILAYYRSTLKPYRVAVFIASQNILLILFIWFFIIHSQGGMEGVLKGYAVSSFLSLMYWVPHIFREKLESPSFSQYRILLRFAAPLMIINLMGLLTNYVDRYFIAYFLGKTATGIYSVSYKLGMMTYLLLSAFRMAWYPKFYALYNDNNRELSLNYAKKTLSILIIIMGTAAFFITIFSRQIAAFPVPHGTFIGKEYWSGLYITSIVALAYVFDAASTLLDSFLYFEKKTRLILIASGIGLFTNIIMNLLLIRPLGLYGAALSTLLSYLALFFAIQYINTNKINIQILSVKSVTLMIYFILIVMAGQFLHKTGINVIVFSIHCVIMLILLRIWKNNGEYQSKA